MKRKEKISGTTNRVKQNRGKRENLSQCDARQPVPKRDLLAPDARRGPNSTSANARAIAPPFSDEFLALYFSRKHADELRYTAARGRWSVWDGKRWKQDGTLAVFDKVRDLCREEARELAELQAGRNAKGIARSPSQIASAVTVAAIERLARSARCHAMEIGHWDCDLWALNTPDGPVDLRTGKVGAHGCRRHFTKITSVGPGGDCPLWHKFLNRITAGDLEFQRFLQRMAGYALTGSTREHALFFLYGIGANGKSVLTNTTSGVMGDYARPAPIETFIASAQERHPTDVAGLQGVRLVTAFETEEGRRWAESKIKLLTGGDRISARFMRQDFFDYVPQFKLVIAGNHKPSLNSVDEAIRRRLHLVPFNVMISEKERDKDLPDKLKAEWGGILAWMIEGCLAWQREGLNPPRIVVDATTDYLSEQDTISQWIEERCTLGRGLSAIVADLYGDWQEWCGKNDQEWGSKKVFSQRLEKQGLGRKAWAHARGFVGIGLKNSCIAALPGPGLQ